VRVVRVEAVDVRPEAVPGTRETRHLPEVREQLGDLAAEPVVAASHATANGTAARLRPAEG